MSLWLETSPAIPTDPFEWDGRYDTVVVGAGLTGLATAVMLARAGGRVAVLEARTVGAVTTGNTTGKVSLLQGTTLAGIRRRTSDRVLCAYVDGNTAGQGWLLDFLDAQGVPYEMRDAVTYATSADGVDQLEAELAALQAAGLPAGRTPSAPELPFAVAGALTLGGQAQVHPMLVLAALAAELRRLGGRVVEGERVTAISASAPAVITSTSGRTQADQVVLATGTPILDRGLYFAKTAAERSYVAAFRVPGDIPQAMYLSPRRRRVPCARRPTPRATCCWSAATVIRSAARTPPRSGSRSSRRGPRSGSLAPSARSGGRRRTTAPRTTCRSSAGCLAGAAASSSPPATPSGA